MTDVEQAVPAEPDVDKLDPVIEMNDTLVDSEVSSTSGSSSEGIDKNDESKPPRRQRRILWGVTLTLVVVGAVIGVLFGVGVFDGSNNGGADGADGIENPGVGTPSESPTPASAPPVASSPVTSPPEATSSPVTSPPEATEAPTESLVSTVLMEAISPFSGERLEDPTSPQYRAFQWMTTEDVLTTESTSQDRLQQRYAMVTLYFSLTGAETGSDLPSFVAATECFWPTVVCGGQVDNENIMTTTEEWRVTEIRASKQSLVGEIPPEIGLLEPSLVYLDLSENSIQGSLPDEFYLLSNLIHVYLNNNIITGPLTESIGNLQLLEKVYLGNNQFNGTIPSALQSGTVIRPLRYLILHRNQFSGTIPANLRLRQLFYLDLSFNQLSGTLPADMGETFVKLRALYLDHNNLSGTIPESFATIGNSRMKEYHLNDNYFNGTIPSGWVNTASLNTLNFQGNGFLGKVPDSICKMHVFNSGELVELGAECDICNCKTGCEKCY